MITRIDNFYIVYNISIRKFTGLPIHPKEDLDELYDIILSSPEVVNTEYYSTPDQLLVEIRVVFWNKQAYEKFALRNGDRYKQISAKLIQNYVGTQNIFERHTSEENYQSAFPPAKKYLPRNDIIDWTLTDYFKEWFVNNIIPVGKVRDYIGNGKHVDAPVLAARFFKARTGDIKRLPPDQKSFVNFPTWVAYNFEHTLQYAINHHIYIYGKFTKLCYDVEKLVSKYISACEHSAVLVGHESLGDKINVHTHRLSLKNTLSITCIARITFDDLDPVRIGFYPSKDESDPNLPLYYQTQSALLKSIEGQEPEIISPQGRLSLLMFNAGYVPHTVNYNKDIYLYFVYDNVVFHDGMLDEFKRQSSQILYKDHKNDKQVYFFDYQINDCE
jgi:hypothetical protein